MDCPLLLFVTSLQAPPNGFTTGGQLRAARAPCPMSACALPHACEVGPFPAETIDMAGAQADQTQVAAALQARINPTQLSIHGLMVSMDAWHSGEPGFDSLLRQFFKNLTHH